MRYRTQDVLMVCREDAFLCCIKASLLLAWVRGVGCYHSVVCVCQPLNDRRSRCFSASACCCLNRQRNELHCHPSEVSVLTLSHSIVLVEATGSWSDMQWMLAAVCVDSRDTLCWCNHTFLHSDGHFVIYVNIFCFILLLCVCFII